MSQPRKKLHLNVFLMNVGHHEAAWRRKDTSPQHATDIRYFTRLAQIAENAKFDSLFLADVLSVGKNIRHGSHVGLEPFTLLSALAAVTEHIGLIGTVSTTFNEPFHVARKFASLDHISSGRAGWNIVTSASEFEAANFSQEEHLQHAKRYERAREFLDVATKLWDSWQDDAIVFDRESGIFADDSKVTAINHAGAYFNVNGPLNVPRAPQGYPVLVQAGSSEDGKEFAAQYAEAIFTAQQTLAEGQQFYADVKGRLAKYGRDPDQIKILPGICPIIAPTESEAKEKEQELNELTVPAYGLNQLSGIIGIDLSSYPLDGPLPELPPLNEINGNKSRYQLVTDLAAREHLTIRQLISKLAGGRGHRVFAGTAIQVADQLEEWFTQGASDGFNVMPPYLPAGLEDFAQLVVPELQRRGLFRTEYESRTLRGNYGLARPSNRWAAPIVGATR
ncbi:Nitrilotriacetate monooxygenase component A/pristinamycin IIA synthase subunit A [Paenibacillus curdlanolyticus YK9]|uniref:Nitrilotriacetate monooxygenase component A/pristinamycin IIA synthase subunit A n=1 Tax=Paenibacillus curdlanolyticus YK9 TaxID=717606 RepID=E0I9L2_9BACL|nr:LLM class flavin-dependent oxidoreductase [Paenibacillus curdlanolyticus]EFM11096.1 Nitrilotriacetate monooxygenase component A/pristinamycin IIA synthase subunit A [Paenibacillus curdlanolyticus YK9]